MSHFSVVVVGENWEKQLKPYDENKSVKRYPVKNRKTIHKELKAEIAKLEGYLADPKAEDKYNVKYIKERLAEFKAMTPKQYWEEHVVKCYEPKDIKDGVAYSTYNPKSKWDWYTIGGRWMGFFKAKKGVNGKLGQAGVFENKAEEGHFDQLRKGDIDWEGMVAESKAEREKWWAEAEGKAAAERYFRYGIEKNMTKDEYLKKGEGYGVYAIVKGGKWYENGEMGWWGITSNEKMSDDEWRIKVREMIDALPENTLLTMVDCHI
jgi:hypothetical protein